MATFHTTYQNIAQIPCDASTGPHSPDQRGMPEEELKLALGTLYFRSLQVAP